MTSSQILESEDEAIAELDSTSYTAIRLEHATQQHIHLTTRRTFIGPIPEGWLKSHRKSWYRQSLSLANYSSRAATFSAGFSSNQQNPGTARDGRSAFSASFPQPDDVDEGDDRENEDDRVSREQASGQSGAGKIGTIASSHQRRNDGSNDEQMATSKLTVHSPTTPSASTEQPYSAQTSPKGKVSSSDAIGSPDPSIVAAIEPENPRWIISSADSKECTNQELNDSKSKAPNVVSINENASRQSLTSPHSATQAAFADDDLIPTRNETTSTTSLLPHDLAYVSAIPSLERPIEDASVIPRDHVSTGMVRFNVPKDPVENARSRKNQAQTSRRKSWRQLRRGGSHPGEIIKMEKMLVKVDSTMQELPSDYNENDSLKTESRTVDKWSELIVVCRESIDDESDFTIQMYKSRVIPAIEKPHVSKRPAHEIALVRKNTKVNMYSSLDKTLVIWVPWKIGTRIYILRTRAAASAVEWYTFIRSSLGWKRSSNLQVNVPDLSITLHIEDPFEELEASREAARASAKDEAAITKTLEAERAVASRIIQLCMEMLEDSPEWASVVEAWLKNEKMGLAWKRYDRLEWIHGSNEQRMYGTIAMQKSHELELRPKQHYPTSIKSKQEADMDEPSPVEGFLIRLTSQKGQVRRLGKMFYKRLYFSTHNQFLCYCRPAKALPPPPPKLTLSGDSKIPSTQQIVNRTPVIYTVDPFPISQGDIAWLRHRHLHVRQKHDQEAYKEAERQVNSMLQAEGYINLSHITRVQEVHRGSSPADANIDQGPDVDFHEEVTDSRRDDGKTTQFDDNRTFELVLKNGLVIRLQAYSEHTKKEWMVRLKSLVHYWKIRLADDMNVLKMIRQLNLERLDIDEEMESAVGQFAEKWEVTRAEASPQLFNMCGISCCRAITMSGVLYRKPTRHSTFIRSGVILCNGQLLIFHGTLRKRTGQEVPHIQHDRQTAIDLKDCYIYSGLVTEGDLLYQNQTFDSNNPGHHALPRVYLEDGWTSTDEDTMTSFVIWHGRRKSLFRANEDAGKGRTRQRLRYVSRLGVPGRTIVFKTRSRAERDHWVLAIGMEIDRLQGGEDIRLAS